MLIVNLLTKSSKKRSVGLSLIFLLLSHLVYAKNHTPDLPIGLWKIMDTITHQPRAVVQLSQAKDKMLSGRILKIYSPYLKQPLCTACIGPLHNKPLIGMTIIKKLKQSTIISAEWQDGEILDPHNGQIYHCHLNVVKKGQQLNVREYISLPLFGRKEIWLKIL